MERGGRSEAFYTSHKPQFAAATAADLKPFLEEMRQARPPLAAAVHSLEILGQAFAGYESAQTGETIWLDRWRAASLHA